jgi:hypothetical protein
MLLRRGENLSDTPERRDRLKDFATGRAALGPALIRVSR